MNLIWKSKKQKQIKKEIKKMENEKVIEIGPFNDDTTIVIMRKIYLK